MNNSDNIYNIENIDYKNLKTKGKRYILEYWVLKFISQIEYFKKMKIIQERISDLSFVSSIRKIGNFSNLMFYYLTKKK